MGTVHNLQKYRELRPYLEALRALCDPASVIAGAEYEFSKLVKPTIEQLLSARGLNAETSNAIVELLTSRYAELVAQIRNEEYLALSRELLEQTQAK